MRCGDLVIRWTTTISVLVLAAIAAVLSYKHMFTLVREYGETSWTAALLPVSVDGMIVASSMTLLADSRSGRRSGFLPWTLLVVGSAASLAANVAVAEPSAVGRVIAAWPSCALIGSYELLMRQVRHAASPKTPVASEVAHTSPVADNAASYEPSYEAGAEKTVPSYVPHTALAKDDAASDDAHTTPPGLPTPSYEVQTDSPEHLIRSTETVHAGGVEGEYRDHSPRSRPPSGLQRQAWQWAVANRTPTGDLPSGKAIGERFGRRERWGRLVKQAGAIGRLDQVATQ
ncbi:DUF2637 domain-containing protein [Actinomadura alba]|uniref:DUF2637 domain-containing protein n=1 Tax=Actinomadura alba TaxID=406431 RepID=UPI001FE3B5D8|nr:DUF2637 domain-containing protein [Actinomadura alba]